MTGDSKILVVDLHLVAGRGYFLGVWQNIRHIYCLFLASDLEMLLCFKLCGDCGKSSCDISV